MLTIDKKIRAEIRRLEGKMYFHFTPLENWSVKRTYYKGPEVYEDVDQDWKELPFGEHIGQKDMTVFLKNQVCLGEDYKGETVVLLLKVGGEGCLSINGAHYNGLDFNRNMIMLTEKAIGDETYDIEVESYCKDLILDSDNAFKTDVVITQSEIASIDRAVWDYYFEIKTGFEFIEGCTEEYTKQRVFKVIYDSLLKLDCLSREALSSSVADAMSYYLEGMKQFKNLKMPVEMYFAGHSHIDVAWHWPLKETVRKVSRTFSSMLRLMEQYDEFKFCQSMPVLYEMAKKYYPEVYEQVKERVKEGRWETLGSMYLEPDCNLISGESFVRQIMYGKKFYQEELGSDSNICFLPDVFGYSSAMPQILKKAGTDYFFTTKLTWNETNEFPYSVFRWRGLDGTEILSGMMSMCTERGLGLYNGDLSAKGIRMSLDYFKNKENGDPLLYLYGHGDGGGGVTKEMLESVTRLNKVPMLPEIKIGTVQEYFENLDKEKEYPVWAGELYFEKHRGTYTTAANNKKNNRKSEFLFRNAEILSVFQYADHKKFCETDLEKGWKLILLNQFHDILPGTCISEVYEECDREYEEIRRIGENSLNANAERIAEPSDKGVTLFNTLSWSRTEVVTVDAKGHMAVKDPRGAYPKQVRHSNGTISFLAEDVPSMGYRCYRFSDTLPESMHRTAVFTEEGAKDTGIENQWFKILADENGEILSLFDKTAGRELLKGEENGNQLLLLEDMPVEWGNAWEVTTKRDDKPPIPFITESLKVEEDNELYTVIRTERKVHNSHISQKMIVYHHASLIEFRTEVDWDEHQKMLRVKFPMDIHTLNARYDVAFGNAEHPNHSTTSYDQARFEVCGHKWGDVSDGSMGTALLNDCKYGYSIQNSDMVLSLLRSADFPADNRDCGHHSFSYWIYPHQGDVKEGRVVERGYEVNVPMLFYEGMAEAEERSYLSADCPNIVIDTVKKAEKGDDLIIRLYETYNTVSSGTLKFGFPVEVCMETDLLERDMEEIPCEQNQIQITVHPYEIRTFKVRMKKF